MLQRFLRAIPVATLFIFFLFICGSLYLTGFWQTFNFDISDFVPITDIPKSFVFPFLVSSGSYFIFAIIQAVSLDVFQKDRPLPKVTEKDNEKKAEPDLKYLEPIIRLTYSKSTEMLFLHEHERRVSNARLKKSLIKNLFSLNTLIFLTVLVFAWTYKGNRYNESYWSYSIIFPILFYAKADQNQYLKKLVPYSFLRQYAIFLILLTPLISFGIGKIDAVKIYNNNEIKLVNVNVNAASLRLSQDSVTCKLLGFVGEKVIVSTLDNKKLFVLNQSAYNALELEFKNAN